MRMKMKILHAVALAGLIGCSGTQGEEAGSRASVVPVSGHVMVAAVKGLVVYAYEGTEWKTLREGNRLCVGATVRTGPQSEALLRNENSFLRVSPGCVLHLRAEQEGSLPRMARGERREKQMAKWQRTVEKKSGFQRLKRHF